MSTFGILKLVRKYALAAPGANTSFGEFVLSGEASQVRITVSLTTASVLNLHVTDAASPTAYDLGLNGSVALAAGDLYSWTFGLPKSADGTLTAAKALTYSFQVETDSVVRLLCVDEIIGATV